MSITVGTVRCGLCALQCSHSLQSGHLINVNDCGRKIGDVQLPLVVPILYFVIITLLVAVPLITKPKESAIGLAMMLGTGVVYYLIVIAWTSKPAILGNTMGTSRLTDYYNIAYNLHNTTEVIC